MRKSQLLILVVIIIGAGVWYVSQGNRSAPVGGDIVMDDDDIGGVVMGPEGPEAGAWVIAETDDLPTKFVRSVVTDDEGRYVIPDLPDANYLIWARGYGLLDSMKIEASPGDRVHLASVTAPDERSAAQVYPAMYWWSYGQ